MHSPYSTGLVRFNCGKMGHVFATEEREKRRLFYINKYSSEAAERNRISYF